ncbi:Ig-like domain-containing protein [Nocardioides sp. zg-DK7169]|uniref:Ig-like domain-containing protein n=1 Tax=Nocardioides sp. zg-DK7169 TaxID=2736600 RepID=UPI001557400E|nr:Ig-like domain-containing protein [Nocardioides sp. zg-DK7169]NPC97263.1 Ig-like domain repeat protein [Nocardioides sp. zg-DK7169]
MHNYLRRRASVGLSAALLAGSLAGMALAPAASAADPVLASGSDWNVVSAPGGYLVTVELDEPLPMRSDAPTIVVDGEAVGAAVESADGLSLTAFTSDPAVAGAESAEAGWSSQSVPGSSAPDRAVEVPDAPAPSEISADPAAKGSYAWTESIYKFGDQAIDLAAIGGVRGELEGKVYLPTTGGPRPTVLLLHGRHTSCYGTGPTHNNRWPCATAPDNELRMSIPSYAGYDGTAQALASHGYAVVSISANAINSNDNQLAADRGAVARGQLLLDTLEMLRKANAGEKVAFHDEWTDRTLTLDEALVEGARSYELRREGFVNGAPDLDQVTAADLVGRFDLSSIGMMGHSRGGEGVTAAATLNQGLDTPWAIESILPLAPVDFGRMTVPNVPMNVVLPYCDGDVSNQQGQHMLDDSRYAFGDDVLRSGTWVMGANHNFFNTAWTPGEYKYSVSDDWSNSAARRTEAICGTDPSVAGTSIRLSPSEQYELGNAYMTAWFRATLGGEERFLPLFDGSGTVPASLDGADVRTVATAPSSARSTIASFEKASSLVRPVGSATAAPCASMGARTTVQSLAACSTSLASAQLPHWTPATNGGNVPATPVTRFSWTGANGQLRVSVPAARRDAGAYDRLSVKLAADETVETATDLVLSVVDGAGRTFSAPVSELNPYALVRMPTSTSSAATSTLKKIVLQQVNVATADLAAAGLDVANLREVRFAAAPGAEQGAAYLSDLAFESSSVGTPTVKREPVLGVFAPGVDEGNAPGTYDIAVHLDAPASAPVTGYVSLLGSATSRAAAAMEKVTFAPGETCKVVTAPLPGDTDASSTNGTSVTASVINTANAVMGHDAIVFTTIREDDGVTGSATELPAFGEPGDVCAELAAVQAGGTVTAPEAFTPGTEAGLSAAGFRAGEAVTFAADGLEPVTVVADASGTATASLTVPEDDTRRLVPVTATGAATGRIATGELARVKRVATIAVELDAASNVFGAASTVTARVEETSGEVEFGYGDTTVAVPVDASGVATHALPASLPAGRHTITARYLGTDETAATETVSTTYRVTRKATTTSLKVAKQVRKGAKLQVTVKVGGKVAQTAVTGKVRLKVAGAASTTRTAKVGPAGTVRFTLVAPRRGAKLTLTARHLGGGSYAGSASKTVRVTLR